MESTVIISKSDMGQTTDVSSTVLESSSEGTSIPATTLSTVTDTISASKIIIDR